jgi:hypothetical protein
LESPVGGSDGSERVLLAHGCLLLVGIVTPGIRKQKTADSCQEAAVGSGRLICSEDFSLRTSDEFPQPATLGFVSSQVGTLRFHGGIPDV